jgi:hypothetical protein
MCIVCVGGGREGRHTEEEDGREREEQETRRGSRRPQQEHKHTAPAQSTYLALVAAPSLPLAG